MNLRDLHLFALAACNTGGFVTIDDHVVYLGDRDTTGGEPDAHAEEKKSWMAKAVQHRAAGDEDAANHAEWRAGLHGPYHAHAQFSERELGHPANKSAPRASEIGVHGSQGGISYWKPVHELVAKDGSPTGDYWNMWRQSGDRGGSGKSTLVSNGLIPSKTDAGWKVDFKPARGRY